MEIMRLCGDEDGGKKAWDEFMKKSKGLEVAKRWADTASHASLAADPRQYREVAGKRRVPKLENPFV